MTTPDLTSQLLQVAQAWASPDDWNVDKLYIAQLRDLAKALRAGDDAKALARHAKHVQSTCLKADCLTLIPYTVEKDRGLFLALSELAGVRPAREARAKDLDIAVAVYRGE